MAFRRNDVFVSITLVAITILLACSHSPSDEITRIGTIQSTNTPGSEIGTPASQAISPLTVPSLSPTSRVVPTPSPQSTPVSFAELQRTASTPTYDNLFRNNEQYVGRLVYLQGEIIQVLATATDRYELRVNITKRQFGWTDTLYLTYQGSRVLEQDIIEFVGRVSGLITYKSIFGQSITIPSVQVVQANVIQKRGEPAQTLPPASISRITSGSWVQVRGTGDCLNFRESPNKASRLIGCKTDGFVGYVSDGPRRTEGQDWWLIRDLGWAVADWLVPTTPPTTR